MKNLIKISLIAVTFIFVSCNKEVIRPNTPSTDEVFVMKSSQNNINTDENKGVGGPSITDPNNDPDIILKKTVVTKPN